MKYYLILLLALVKASNASSQTTICSDNISYNIPIESDGIIEYTYLVHRHGAGTCRVNCPDDNISMRFTDSYESFGPPIPGWRTGYSGRARRLCVKEGQQLLLEIIGTGCYEFSYEWIARYQSDPEPNNSFEDATTLSPCRTLQGTLNFGTSSGIRDTKDHYKFATTQNGNYVLEIYNHNPCLQIDWITMRPSNSRQLSGNILQYEFNSTNTGFVEFILDARNCQNSCFKYNIDLISLSEVNDFALLPSSSCVKWDKESSNEECAIIKNQDQLLENRCTGIEFRTGGISLDFLPENEEGYIEYEIDEFNQHILFGLTGDSPDNNWRTFDFLVSIQQGETKGQLDIFTQGSSEYTRNVYLNDKVRIYRTISNLTSRAIGRVSFSLIRNGIQEFLPYSPMIEESRKLRVVAPFKSKAIITKIGLCPNWKFSNSLDCTSMISN